MHQVPMHPTYITTEASSILVVGTTTRDSHVALQSTANARTCLLLANPACI